MSLSPTDARPQLIYVSDMPVRRYVPNGDWEPVSKNLSSPAPDGTVIYFQDTLSPMDGEGNFIDGPARAICQYLTALVLKHDREVADGPYLQVLPDDGAVPPGWLMLRALIWVDEYDVLVPTTSSAYDDNGLAGGGVGA